MFLRYSIFILSFLFFSLSASAQMEGTVHKRANSSVFADVDLNGVEVNAKKKKYSRKNNPAVELMRRVIAAKHQTKLTNKPFYQYTNYEKMTLSLNGVTPDMLKEGLIGKTQWLLNQVEYSPINGQLILPFMYTEKVSQVMYRKDPEKRRTYIMGERSKGINEIFETGNIFNNMSEDAFSEVDVYDNNIRLLKRTMLSPIADNAIAFYRYYIIDTVQVDRDSCYHLRFTPNNPQDFGFNGDMYILKDSSLHVRKVCLGVPKQSDLNFVEGMLVNQEYEHLATNDWVLTANDLIIALRINQRMAHCLMVKTSSRSDYSFAPIDDKKLRGAGKERKDPDYQIQDDAFWHYYRPIELTKSEKNMGKMVKALRNVKGFNWVMFFLRPLIENFVETGVNGRPSKVDIGPVNTFVSNNFIDGFRMRLSALTTANLWRQFFLSGYVAHGFSSGNTYYKGELTYSFNKKHYLPTEFPRRTLTLQSSYDIMSPSDMFMANDKDNVFVAWKWATVDKMMYYHRHKLEFEWEEEWGLRLLANLKLEENKGAGELYFRRLSSPDIDVNIRTTELHFGFEYAPGRTFFNTKQHRFTTNDDAPVFSLSHTFGINGFLGGKYTYNVTEASIYKRFWLNSWGKMDWNLKGGMQWNKVPYPLLLMPAANLSYVVQAKCFNLVNNMEFLNDRYAQLDFEWDMAGKILNRIPLIKNLKWREVIGFKMLWGGLSDKNNPGIMQNAKSNVLMAFPDGCNVMNPNRPYMEFSVGVYNIFRFFRVQYVRRLNYLELPTASKHGVRLMFEMSF